MRMKRQIAVPVLIDSEMAVSKILLWIDVNHDLFKVRQVMQKLMA